MFEGNALQRAKYVQHLLQVASKDGKLTQKLIEMPSHPAACQSASANDADATCHPDSRHQSRHNINSIPSPLALEASVDSIRIGP